MGLCLATDEDPRVIIEFEVDRRNRGWLFTIKQYNTVLDSIF